MTEGFPPENALERAFTERLSATIINLVDNAPDVYSRFDRDFRYLYVNKTVERYSRAPRESYFRKTMRELDFPEEICRLWEQTLSRVFKTGHADPISFTWTSAEGPRHFEAECIAERDGSGNAVFVAAVTRDVTDRIVAQTDLRDERQRLRLALGSARIATWDFDPVHGELVWDNRCRDLFGLPTDVPVNYDIFLAGLHPDDRGTIDAAVARTLDPSGSGEFEQEYRTIGFSDGVERWIAAKGRAFFDLTRTRAVRFIGIAHDISEQKRAQQEREVALSALRASENRLRLALDAARMGSWEWDVRTNHLDWSGHLEEIHGMAPGTFDGRFETFLACIHKDDRDRFLTSVADTLECGDTFRTEFRVPFPDGTDHWVAGEGLVERDAEAAPICMLGMGWDITRAKWGEEAAQRAGLRERRIAERLQEALRPTLPGAVSGLRLAEHYRPALDEAEIGGDFYDVFALEKGCYALVVADLSGKGLLAASQIATVRHMLRALLYERYTSLAQSVTTLNAMLADHDLLTGFATLFVGAYDANERTIHYVSCGQEPGILRRAATGETELLGPTGPVLGAFPMARYEERMITLETGDVLALFTDGLTEAGLNRQEMLGVPGVVTALEGSVAGDPSPEEVTMRVMAAIEAAATPDGLRDDICLLVARVE